MWQRPSHTPDRLETRSGSARQRSGRSRTLPTRPQQPRGRGGRLSLPSLPPLTQKQNTNTNGKKTVWLVYEKMSENCTDLVVPEEILIFAGKWEGVERDGRTREIPSSPPILGRDGVDPDNMQYKKTPRRGMPAAPACSQRALSCADFHTSASRDSVHSLTHLVMHDAARGRGRASGIWGNGAERRANSANEEGARAQAQPAGGSSGTNRKLLSREHHEPCLRICITPCG